MNDIDRAYGNTTVRFYDAAYAKTSASRRDGEFYAGLAAQAGGPVLELGCGTGRVLLEIAAQGFPCTGLDASQAMLGGLAAKSPPANLRLACAPMQDFDLGEDRFALIFAGFRVFQHLNTVKDQLDCLACVRRHLAPGGMFAFDVFNPRMHLKPDHQPEQEDLRFECDGVEVVRYVTVDLDRFAQLLHLKMRYEVPREGGAPENLESSFDMRWFHRWELEHLMASAGFGDVTIYGDFDSSPSTADAPALIVVAR